MTPEQREWLQKLTEQKRAEARQVRLARGLPVDQHLDPVKHQAFREQYARRQAQKPPTLAEMVEAAAQLPAHLGWHSTPVAELVRKKQLADAAAAEAAEQPPLFPEKEPAAPTPPTDPVGEINPKTATVKVYPSIALAILRREHSAAGRIYFLLRALDPHGRGWLSVKYVRKKMCAKRSGFRIAKRGVSEDNAWRNLRGLLKRGDGLFWSHDPKQGRLWLHGMQRIALALNCSRLTDEPVLLPVKGFLQGIQKVRAYLLASFHTGREKLNKHGRHVDQPISQARLQALSAVSDRSQRRYHKVARVKVRKNFTLGTVCEADELKERLYDKWGNAFAFKDVKGRHGRAGNRYLASRLPNSYQTSLAQCARGRQQKINAYLDGIDLVPNVGEQGAEASVSASSLLTQRGNGSGRDSVKLFFHNAKLAGRASRREREVDHFFASHVRSRVKRCGFWYELPAEEENQVQPRH